jgi:uncharacterized protein YbjQ (UPF0145 family)
MLITTTPAIEGRTISEYLGVIAGEAVLGANLFKDLFAGIRDIVGGRSGSYEKELKRHERQPSKRLWRRRRRGWAPTQLSGLI